MAEVQTEMDAESVLLSAVMGADAQDLDEAKRPAGLDENTDVDEVEAADEQEAEPAQEKKAEAEAEAPPEDDFVEIEGEDGAEPRKIALKEIVEGFRQHEALKGQSAQIIEQAQTQARQYAEEKLQFVEQQTRGAAAYLQAAMQLLAAPQPPDANVLLDPNSASYDPDKYHRDYASYQRSNANFQQAQGVARELMNRAEQAQAALRDQREEAELQKLQRVWPEFTGQAVDKFVTDMSAAYGYTREELDASMTDHRNALVARDALAYRAMKAQSGAVRDKVEKAAPNAKLVKSKQASKGGERQNRDAGGRFVNEALATLKKTNSDDAAAAYFAGLAKIGRL